DKGVIVANEEKNNIYSRIKQSKQIIQVEFDKETDEQDLIKIAGVSSVTEIREKTWILEAGGDEDNRPAIFSFAVNNNLTVLSLQKKESNLEEVFRHLTNG
ncbi:MAG TPA: DUF4162 domain-containing protein, partial [Bacteroidales bacterium]|nr:DUF4162 domain-containing protein [Bacteroidales bacterium]